MREVPPSEWDEVKVADVIERHFCGPSPDCEERPVFDDAEWGVLKTTAITWSGWNQDAHKVLPRPYWGRDGIEVKAGDVLVTKAGPRHRVAVVTHVPATRQQLVVSGKMIGLRPRLDLVLPEVLAGLLALPKPQKYILDRTTGMAESQVNFANDVLLDTPLQVPPKAEQTGIAHIAGALDTTIRQTEAIVEKLRQVKQGLLHDLLTRGIDANGELRPPRSQAPHLYKESPLGWIPQEWTASSIEQACSDVVDCPHSTPKFLDDGVLVARTMHIKSGVFLERLASRVSEAEYRERIARLRPEPGDIVFTREAPVGEAFVIPAGMRICLGQRVMLLRPRSEMALGQFLLAQIYSGAVADRIAALTAGTTNPHLNVGEVRKFVLPLPPVPEQTMIEQQLGDLDSRIAVEGAERDKLLTMKAGLMDDLLTGRVRVTSLLA